MIFVKIVNVLILFVVSVHKAESIKNISIIYNIKNSTMYPIKIKAHDRFVKVLKFNYDGDLFFTGEADRLINVFWSFTGQLLGSYTTNVAVKTLDVDINSKYLVYGSLEGTIQVFDVRKGTKLLTTNYPYHKISHLQFDISSKKLMVLHQTHSQNQLQQGSHIKIIDFQNVINLISNIKGQDKVVPCQQIKVINNFALRYQPKTKAAVCQKAKWYVDNQSVFVVTNGGEVAHFNLDGKLIKKAIIHPGVKIRSLNFSNDYSILATAAEDGCKVLDPQTLQVLRVFKQQHPMNEVSISPLFNHPVTPKHHLIVAGGVDSKVAARSKGAGFDVHLCNVMYQKQIGKLLTHFSPINSLEFFKDGLGYVTCADDSVITIVRFQEGYFKDEVYE